MLWYPIQRINPAFCSLVSAASWPSAHIQFAHFSSALTCANLLKRLSLKEQTNRGVNRRLCWLWRGCSLLFPCSHQCGSFQETPCCLSALLSQARALLGSVKCRLSTQHPAPSEASLETGRACVPFLSTQLACGCLGVPCGCGQQLCVSREVYTWEGTACSESGTRVLPRADGDLWLRVFKRRGLTHDRWSCALRSAAMRVGLLCTLAIQQSY